MAELRIRQIRELQLVSGVKEVKAGEIFECPFTVADGSQMMLQINCPPQFPTHPPTISIKPPHRVQHPQVHPTTQEIITPELQSQWAPQRPFSGFVKRLRDDLQRATNITGMATVPSGPYPSYQDPYRAQSQFAPAAPYYMPPTGPGYPPAGPGFPPNTGGVGGGGGGVVYTPNQPGFPLVGPGFPPHSSSFAYSPYPSAPYMLPPSSTAPGPYPSGPSYVSGYPGAGPGSSPYPGAYGPPQPYQGGVGGGGPYPSAPTMTAPYNPMPMPPQPTQQPTSTPHHHPSTHTQPVRPPTTATAVPPSTGPLFPARPAPPPPVAVHAVVVLLPGLAGKTADELQRLHDDAGLLDDFLETQKPFRDLDMKESEMRERNQSLAEKNVAKRAELEAAETRLRQLMSELDTLRTQVDAECSRHQAATERFSPRALIDLMAAAEHAADTKSETIATQLTSGTLKADEFCKQFLVERKAYHLRSAKLTLLRERGLVQ